MNDDLKDGLKLNYSFSRARFELWRAKLGAIRPDGWSVKYTPKTDAPLCKAICARCLQNRLKSFWVFQI